MKIEFHAHTYYSDGVIPLSYIKYFCRDRMVIITDHNNIEGSLKLSKEVPTIIAEEITCLENNKKIDVIGLFLTEHIDGKKYSFREVIDKIHEQGGIAVAPHIMDHKRNGAGLELAKYFDVIEVFNSKADQEANELAMEKFKDSLKIIGTDAHIWFDLGATLIEIEDFDIENPKEFLKNLKTAKFLKMNYQSGISKFARKIYRLVKYGTTKLNP
jgi:predicted metal-dependent phosphoesterase TrpH